MSVNCEVIFDNSTNVFYTGQTVTGRVILTISVEPISFRGKKKKYNKILDLPIDLFNILFKEDLIWIN